MFENPINKAYVGGNQIIRAYNGDGAPHIWPINMQYVTSIMLRNYGYEGNDGNIGKTLTITFNHYGTNATTTKPKLYYRIGIYHWNGKTSYNENKWTELTGNSVTITGTTPEYSNYSDIIEFCGQGNEYFSRSENDYTTITLSGNAKVEEMLICLDTLLDYDNPPTTISDWSFHKLIQNGFPVDVYAFGIMIHANSAGYNAFNGMLYNTLVGAIIIMMPNLVNAHENTFNNWIVNTSGVVQYYGSVIECKQSLNLPINSPSGIPEGWEVEYV